MKNREKFKHCAKGLNDDSVIIDEIYEGQDDEVSKTSLTFQDLLQQNTIVIEGQISAETCDNVALPLLELDADPDVDHIDIYINCSGGGVFDGLYLCNIIENLKTETTITVLGYAYSMAGYILMAGYNNPNVTRKCYKYSSYLLHSGSLSLQGEAKGVKEQYDFFLSSDNLLIDFVVSHSKMSRALAK